MRSRMISLSKVDHDVLVRMSTFAQLNPFASTIPEQSQAALKLSTRDADAKVPAQSSRP